MNVIQLIFTLALQGGIDPHLALAIAQTESQLDQSKIGALKEVGTFQVRPEYSTKNLHNLKENIKEGIRILKSAQKSCKHKEAMQWIVCYNAGNTGGSRLKHPQLFPYYVKVMGKYKEMKQTYANAY